MPLYEYRCEDCGLTFEVRQKFTDKPVATCRECGGSAKKLVSRGAFTLKGGGWYDQGYAQPSPAVNTCSKPAAAGSACDSCPAAKAANA